MTKNLKKKLLRGLNSQPAGHWSAIITIILKSQMQNIEKANICDMPNLHF